ncbi:MAG TPA: protein translocase subunit SecD [Burkholderiales bacterium]|nr:protein translocase subunit SecD [Burkholderiales bacterium]
MTKYPLWKYLVIIIAVVIGLIYSLPNIYGQTAAVQISVAHSAIQLDSRILENIEKTLLQNEINPTGEVFDGKTLKIKFSDPDTQLKARDLIQQYLGDNYVVALNLVPNSPQWLTKIRAYPMFLGLDLRGGVHFLEEVDMTAAIKKTLDKSSSDIKRNLRNNKIRYGSIIQTDSSILIHFRDNETANDAYNKLIKDFPSMQLSKDNSANLAVIISPEEIQKIKEDAVKKNILILHNRINELGVAEPLIQQQGSDRIAIDLPGVQDTARAKEILGRTATLEVRMVNDSPTDLSNALTGNVPPNFELLDDKEVNGSSSKILVSKNVELTGDSIIDAQAGFDENNSPAVTIRLDSSGSAIFKQLTGENIGKRMAMVLIDNGKGQVVTAPFIKVEIGGGQVQISGGSMSVEETTNVALLLRSGSLAAPMSIIEENTIGPALGKENIAKGFHSVLWGFTAITIFMVIYYLIFGIVSVISLAINLLLLIAILSMLQATLTLPGLAAIALALGMAIDSNVLINERIREEIRKGKKLPLAIQSGYEHAWATILDSNVTTLIAGLALLAFGTGSVKGFAVVHCLGILTSMFSAVLVSRGIVALLYANRRIKKLYI